MHNPHFLPLSLVLGSLGLLATACNSERAPETVAQPLTPAAPAATGSVTLDGSSTVLPITRAMAEAFQAKNPGVKVGVAVSGTGGGFRELCAGRSDIAGASRPINAGEAQKCRDAKVDYIELPIAFDSLSVVTSRSNDFLECLTVAELKTLWEPAAEGRVTRWNQVRASFPDRALSLFGPDRESGTFDYFTLATVGTEGSSRKDYTASPDDEVIEQGVQKSPDALGFFGYSYYLAHREQLEPVAIDAGKGCVEPSPASVRDGSYQPLSRPIFLYVSKLAAVRPEVRSFARFYLSPDNAGIIEKIGYVPLPPAGQAAELARFEGGVTGSVLGAHGSVIGVRPDRFGMDEDRLRSALVQ